MVISSDDERNPVYYELRAGHPPPDAAFYENRKDGNQSTIHFTDENFVRGFNLTTGEYYRLRQDMANLLLPKQLYLRNFSDTDTERDVWPISKQIWGHKTIREAMNSPRVPPYWKFNMVFRFVTRIATWLKSNNISVENGKLKTFPKEAIWTWGPLRQHEDFDGWYQFQHIQLSILHHERESQINPEQWVINVLDLVDGTKKDKKEVHDISIKDVKFSIFVDELKTFGGLKDFSLAAHVIQYTQPGNQSVVLQIKDDNSLQNALPILRQKNSYQMQFTITTKRLFNKTKEVEPRKPTDDNDDNTSKKRKAKDRQSETRKARKKLGVRTLNL